MKSISSFILFLAASASICSCSRNEYLDYSPALVTQLINAKVLEQPEGPQIIVSKQKDEKTFRNLDSFYKLTPQGFNEGDRYYGYRINANYDQQYLGKCIVQEDGDLLWESTGKTVGSMLFSRGGGFINGEQWFLILVSENKQKYIVTAITPDPIEYQWEDGAYVSLTLSNCKKWEFLLAGKGFKPNEILNFSMAENDFHFDSTLKADSEGMLIFAIPPLITNKENEKATLKFARQNTDEISTLSFLFGRAALVKALPSKYPNVESVNLETLEFALPFMMVFTTENPS